VDENLMRLKINVIEIQLIENYENISFSFSTFSAQPVISCAIVVRALSAFSFTLQRVASPKRSHF